MKKQRIINFCICNQILFTGENGTSDIKLIDFQIMRVCSPLTDIPYFLFASTSSDVMNNHLDELMDVYYNRLMDVLKKIGCDTEDLSRKNFDDELDKVAKLDLFRCITAAKFITFDPSEISKIDMDNIFSVIGSPGSKLYYDRINDIITKYIEKGWL